MSAKALSARRHLGDFAVAPRMFLIAAWALPVGVVSALAAWALLRLIGLVTNLVFYQRVDTRLIAPDLGHHNPLLVLTAPVAGGLVIGFMARFGSEKIRGHGMPEAIEAILTGGSRISPRVALLKPVSSAISIGTGGPFGAEGPIIMTGGAIGSILAQALRLSADERKTLLVAGAAGGMAATFNSPLAAALLAVELLLFEWRPRSFVPVVASVGTATVTRWALLGSAPLFPVPVPAPHLTGSVEALCVLSGVTGGLLAVAATALVYLAEDGFGRLPIHWMWWPAIGGVAIGVGGLIEPRALGVGYDVIDELLTGRAGFALIIGILTVKTIMWSLSLGSGTSGGVLAPIFMIGGALGALEGHWLPTVAPGFWAMTGLAAVVGGVMRSPLTGVVFTLELTHAWGAAPALLVASTSAFALSAIVLKRSVLTEKIARRGLHLTRDYTTDPLETFFVDDVMITDVPVLSTQDSVGEVLARLSADGHIQPLYPVAGPDGGLAGVVTHANLARSAETGEHAGTVARVMSPASVLAHPDDTLRHVAYLFAEHATTHAPVVERTAPHRPTGLVSLPHLLRARLHDLTEEHHRQRVLPAPRRAVKGLRPAGRPPGRRPTGRTKRTADSGAGTPLHDS